MEISKEQYTYLMSNPAVVEAKTTIEYGFVKNIPAMQNILQEVYSQLGGGILNFGCPCVIDDLRRLFNWVKEYELINQYNESKKSKRGRPSTK